MLSIVGDSVIVRIWHGWTSVADADTYQDLLESTILPGIAARQILGHRSTEILKRTDEDPTSEEVEFVTVMVFDDWAAVTEFAGGDGLASVVPASARKLLSRFDDHSQHYETVARRRSPSPSP